ncbi:MAG: transposase [Firmicutes bacterium]|nr:transposase [Bacillota bacterium]
MKHQVEVGAIFDKLVAVLTELLPDFGERLAFDGKALESHANPRKKGEEKAPDGRRDLDADIGVKTYRGQHADGTVWEKTASWFGYRLHLLVDAAYELPVAYEVTKASEAEIKHAHKILDETATRHPEIVSRCGYFSADRGMDDGKLIVKLWDEYGIKPVIDIRNSWRDGEGTRLVTGETNVVYDYKGTVYCHDPLSGARREMAYAGFEKDRGTLKYRCPAMHYGIVCPGREECPVRSGVRIKMEEDRRIFTPLARSSYKWEREYHRRTAVERVNSRIDVVFGFENHYIRGLKKMRTRMGLALCVMLAMAVGRLKEKKPENIRSLVRAS